MDIPTGQESPSNFSEVLWSWQAELERLCPECATDRRSTATDLATAFIRCPAMKGILQVGDSKQAQSVSAAECQHPRRRMLAFKNRRYRGLAKLDPMCFEWRGGAFKRG